MSLSQKELRGEAVSRRLRIAKARAGVAEKALALYHGYGGESLFTAVVDLLVDAQHLADHGVREGPTYDGEFTIEEAAAVAAEIYRSERVDSVTIADEKQVPPEPPQESG